LRRLRLRRRREQTTGTLSDVWRQYVAGDRTVTSCLVLIQHKLAPRYGWISPRRIA